MKKSIFRLLNWRDNPGGTGRKPRQDYAVLEKNCKDTNDQKGIGGGKKEKYFFLIRFERTSTRSCKDSPR